MTFFLWKKEITFIALTIFVGLFLSLCYKARAEEVQSPGFGSFFLNEHNYGVIVGKAAANAHVELFDGARKLGDTSTNSEGNFTITLKKILGAGQYRLVLRATDESGKSVTSLQTVTIFVPENRDHAMTATINDPTSTYHHVSDNRSIIHMGKNKNRAFEVTRVTYQGNILTLCGHAEKNTHVIAALGNARFGHVTTNSAGDFSLSRFVSLFPGNHAVRLDLSNDSGEIIDTVSVPLKTEEPAPFLDQAFRHGKPIRIFIVKKGDTLSSIAQKIYGSSRYGNEIYAANSAILKNRNHIVIGQELVLPMINGTKWQ